MSSEEEEEEEEEQPVNISYSAELSRLFLDALPISLSYAFQNVMQAGSILICGRLGTFELTVASFGYMFFSSTAVMSAVGASSAIDTLASNALGVASTRRGGGDGGGDASHYIGIVLQRGILFISVLFFVVIIPLWWNSGPIFRHLGQDEGFASATQTFLRTLLPAGFVQIVAECLKKFLQVQDHRGAVSWCIGIGAGIALVANYVLVLHTGLGITGAAISHAIYYLTTIVMMVVYIAWTPSARQHWGGFTWKVFQDSWPFTSLAISGLLAVATEFWCFQSVALMAATLDYASVGAQGIVMTSDLIFATVPFGLGIATSHRIGKSLGAGKKALVQFQTRIPYLLAFCIGCVECVILLAARNVYGRAFSDDADVVRTTAAVLPLLAGFQFLDLANNGAAGILRGVGKTHLAGGSNVLGYYGVGLILAWVLCFRVKMGLFGLWAGLITGSGIVLILQSIWVFITNWEKETARVLEEAKKRVTVEDNETTPLLLDT